MTQQDVAAYYSKKINKYWKKFTRLFLSAKKILPKYIDDFSAEKFKHEIVAEFESILKDLPYLGGDRNMMTLTLVSAGLALAYIRVLERYGLKTETIGNILHEVHEDVFMSLPVIVKWWLRNKIFSFVRKNNLKNFAKESQKREYPENWVMTFIDGNGVDFDYGYNYSECALLKYYQKMGAEAYMPYLCSIDMLISNALKTGLRRTKTLSWGCEKCDFRYKKNQPSMPGLPLQNLPEYKNRKL